MKKVLAAALVLSVASGARAIDSMEHMDHAGHGAAKTSADAAMVEGVVKKVDRAAGTVTLAHGPLPNGMPGMTMSFKVKEPSRLDGVRIGQTVLFAVDDAMTVIRLETTK